MPSERTFILRLGMERPNMVDLLVVAATFAAILFAFAVVPEILERRGHDARSAYTRAIVWTTFLAIVFIPAALSGFLFRVTNPIEWLLLTLGLAGAILWEFSRLHPAKVAPSP
jgi:high-affinity K+ transport system ATPase subunit B